MIAVCSGIVGLLIGMGVGSRDEHRGDRFSRYDDNGGMMDHRNTNEDTKRAAKDETGMMGMDHSDMNMGMDMNNMMVESEREFITEMIPHHELILL